METGYTDRQTDRQTDGQTGLLTVTAAIPKQTRLKPASLIVRYKAPTYLILLLFSF